MAVGFLRCDHEKGREGGEGRATRSTTRTARSKTGDAVRPLARRTYFGCAREHRPRDLGIPALTFAAGAELPALRLKASPDLPFMEVRHNGRRLLGHITAA